MRAENQRNDEESRRAVERAAALLREHPRAGEDPAPWRGLQARGGNGKLPALVLEDFSDIPFLDGVQGVEWYQLRSRTRAGDGDVCVSTQRPIDGYESYNKDMLGIGEPAYLRAAVPGADPLCVAGTCLKDPLIMRGLVRLADENGGLLVHPYMGSRAVWELALELRERVKTKVRVLAPFPPATYAANHKGLLTQAATVVLGPESVCRTVSSNDLQPLARAAQDFAGRFPAVALKVANYASGMGNQVFNAKKLGAGTVDETASRIAVFAKNHAWDGRVEILLTQWRSDVLQSPSTQLWVPPAEEGPPRVDGVYEQILTGKAGVFQGSMPSALPEKLQRKMADMSREVARVWQALGYVGRCSFDFLLCGEDIPSAKPMFVECNGRWGGTSIPMALCERVFGRGRLPCYRARDYVDSRLKGIRFADFLKIFGASAYDVRSGQGHYIFYNVGCLLDFGKFDVIAVGADREEASARLEEELPRLIDRAQ
ncbi:MAG: hypothetical protein ABIJ96_09540 [Elusimicrobiota bacterium]